MAGVTKFTDVSNRVSSKVTPNNSPNLRVQVLQALELIGFLVLWILQVIYFSCEKIFYLFNKIEPRSVKNSIVLITGTGHGIGRELALKYADEGATVVCWDINKENNDQTVKVINDIHVNKAFGYVVDVSDAETVVNTAKLVKKQVGEVDILIANAGIMPCHPLVQHTREEIRKIMDINVFQLFWLMEAFLPAMIKNNRGHIVAMSSIAGLGGFPNLVPYCASKWAVRGMMEGLHEELRTDKNSRIKFTTVYPFMVDTGLCKNPKIKFTTLMKMLKPDQVAHEIMMAQRTDTSEISLPYYLLPLNNTMRIFPRKAVMKWIDFMDSGLDSDLQKIDN